MIKQHFGPGNQINFLTSSRKDQASIEDSYDDEEEGLDDREPEKAICPDNTILIHMKQHNKEDAE